MFQMIRACTKEPSVVGNCRSARKWSLFHVEEKRFEYANTVEEIGLDTLYIGTASRLEQQTVPRH